ncbi:hypothetical protein BGW38_007900 [Lunasporangiospora selenospora]|uniref:Transmembrane protein n=1 Tax=Lunasporangiospora selenospora TaxID=979761 RepID=A0A9P6FKH4_9FUNG|nr:hypothetical protein BGW38_007900 [Lunasporangiospora selenospora]
MACLFGRKTAGTRLASVNYARGLVIALYLISWVFSVIAAMLVQTNNGNLLSCQLSILSCIALYALSKVVIYLFLMEKVYVVTAVGVTRTNFFLYKVNAVLMMPYVIVITLMVVYRNAYIRDDDKCYIGLFRAGALPLILYDIVMSCWLTFLFLKPLMSSSSFLQGPSKGKLRNVARRTLLGCIVSLILSSANIFTLAYFDGHERGLVCLSCCTVDVTLNAIAIHWVTSRGGGLGRGNNNNNSERATGGAVAGGGGGATGRRGVHSFGVNSDKQIAPLESHISVTVESYVEEYHQLHYAGNRSTHY